MEARMMALYRHVRVWGFCGFSLRHFVEQLMVLVGVREFKNRCKERDVKRMPA